jgi:hypothetical protein
MQIEFATVTWPILQLVIVIIVVFFLGAFLGFYSSGSETKKKLKDTQLKADMAEHARSESERALNALRAAQQAVPPAVSLPGKSLLRLWLDEGERPRLDLDGQAVDTSPISEASRKRLIMLINVLRPWIEARPAATPAPLPPAPVAAAPSPVVAAPKPVPASAPAPVKPLPAKKDEKPSAPLTMVGQIDEILQMRLAGGPMANRGIQLIESPEGTVIVVVGLEKFNGVGEVTDPQIQAEIRAAIAAWEKKYTPGL